MRNDDFDDKKQTHLKPNKANLNPFQSQFPVETGRTKTIQSQMKPGRDPIRPQNAELQVARKKFILGR